MRQLVVALACVACFLSDANGASAVQDVKGLFTRHSCIRHRRSCVRTLLNFGVAMTGGFLVELRLLFTCILFSPLAYGQPP